METLRRIFPYISVLVGIAMLVLAGINIYYGKYGFAVLDVLIAALNFYVARLNSAGYEREPQAWICPKCYHLNDSHVICFGGCGYEKGFLRWAWDEKVPFFALLFGILVIIGLGTVLIIAYV